MTDYESKVHNLYASFDYKANEKLMFNGMVTLNKAESSLDEVQMPDSAYIADRTGDDLIDNQDYDFTKLGSYSDMSYQLLDFKLGMAYKLTPTITFTADGEYADLTDDKGYIFGNESGSFFMIRTGFKLDF